MHQFTGELDRWRISPQTRDHKHLAEGDRRMVTLIGQRGEYVEFEIRVRLPDPVRVSHQGGAAVLVRGPGEVPSQRPVDATMGGRGVFRAVQAFVRPMWQALPCFRVLPPSTRHSDRSQL
ncbi:hypothetical protein ASD48_40950 [Streptomyces sp. Root1310]|nr:hypothetical protein ASD48_40950 [Streptomyces sp. Root1310]